MHQRVDRYDIHVPGTCIKHDCPIEVGANRTWCDQHHQEFMRRRYGRGGRSREDIARVKEEIEAWLTRLSKRSRGGPHGNIE